ncbi:MAG: bacillithiol system redox-active protein YtxJ [Ferruginibacter sp.]
MNWRQLDSPDQLAIIKEESKSRPQVIFKHSTRCSISSVAKNRLEKAEIPAHIDFYLLDLLRYRQVSDQVSAEFSVFHESPQVLLIREGECIFDESHGAISMEELIEQAQMN